MSRTEQILSYIGLGIALGLILTAVGIVVGHELAQALRRWRHGGDITEALARKIEGPR